MKVITFSGVDGSGKSTQVEMLREYLVSQGQKVAYFHAVEFSLANKISRLIQGQKKFEPGQEKAVTTTSWLSLHLRIKFLFIDMVRFCFLRSRLKRAGYDYLLSDRSFFDSIVNLEYLAVKHAFLSPLTRWGLNWLAKNTPKADVRFYFDIAPEVIMNRRRVPEQGIDYLQAKIDLFKKKIVPWHMLVIDVSQTKEHVFSQIREKIAM